MEASGTPASSPVPSPAPLDSLPFIAYHGPLSGLLAKVESGEFVPKLQASHAPPCKFWTAFAVISGIRHVVPVIHGPSGCTYSVAADYKMYACEYRGVPFEPTTCTLLDETNIVYGGEGKLRAALGEAVGKYRPDLIVVLSCCCSGIIGDDVETVAAQAQEELGVRIIAIRSEGFGGDFRSGHEDAFKVIMKLMDPPKPGERLKGTINLVGARGGPTFTERPQDIKELERLCDLMGVRINATIAGGCTLEEIRRAPSVELNASWCYDWGGKIGELMEKRFGVPFARSGLPYGLGATRQWMMSVAGPLGMAEKAEEVIAAETARVADDLAYLRETLTGKTAFIEVAEFPGPIRALAMARMAEEFGAVPVVVNLHPYTVKERKPTIRFLLSEGQDPQVILTKGLFSLGSFEASWDTEREIEAIAATVERDRAVFFGTPSRFPDLPVVNLTNESSYPQFGFTGVRNIAALVRGAMEAFARPRSRLFRKVVYGE